MSSPPRRTRFQIHLSTAIVLMFAADGLIWANVMDRNGFVESFGKREIFIFNYGFPFTAVDVFISARNSRYSNQAAEVTYTIEKASYYPHYWMILMDALIALFTIFSVWHVCEWLIRRRAARKGD